MAMEQWIVISFMRYYRFTALTTNMLLQLWYCVKRLTGPSKESGLIEVLRD